MVYGEEDTRYQLNLPENSLLLHQHLNRQALKLKLTTHTQRALTDIQLIFWQSTVSVLKKVLILKSIRIYLKPLQR